MAITIFKSYNLVKKNCNDTASNPNTWETEAQGFPFVDQHGPILSEVLEKGEWEEKVKGRLC